MEIEFPKPTDVLGRIAAQTAKQVIFQKVREAERENIFAEYNQRVGEVVNATVKRFENGDMIAEIGTRVEAVLPRKEQSRAESYNPGDRLRAVIKGVNRSAKGPQIVLSRTDPALLIKLFEQESAGNLRRHRDDSRRRARGGATGRRWPCTRASATSIRSAPASA
jgi:N utilization substance protein A